jgi:hypothetical protein
MQPRIRIAENVLKELAEFVANNEPGMVTGWGDLFILPNLPVAAIRLHKPIGEYMAYLISRNQDQWPSFSKIVPVYGLPFHIVVNSTVTVENGVTGINGKSAVIL